MKSCARLVQTSRPVTASGCQKTGAPYPIQFIQHCYIVIGLYMILDIWGRNDQTNIAPSSEKHIHNKKKEKKKKNGNQEKRKKKGRFADTRCYRALAAYGTSSFTTHRPSLDRLPGGLYRLDRYKRRETPYTQKKRFTHPQKEVLVIIIIRVERRLNII